MRYGVVKHQVMELSISLILSRTAMLSCTVKYMLAKTDAYISMEMALLNLEVVMLDHAMAALENH